MNLKFYVQLIFLCVLTMIFLFSGAVLNTLVIITILKSTQLRKKSCHFLIMVLSCCDLLTVVIYSSAFLLSFTIQFNENNELYTKMAICWHLIKLLAGISLLALMVMGIERYLGVYYPIFHKTSVTRLTLLAIFIILTTTLVIISTNDLVLSRLVAAAIFMVVFMPPFMFFNHNLFNISRKMRLKKITAEKRRKINLKNVNTCLLACFVFFSIPVCFHVVFSIVEGSMSDNARLSRTWIGTTYVINCSFNSLIFFWKNKVLRSEGIKIIKKIKDRIFGS